jgi:hypothetical protein
MVSVPAVNRCAPLKVQPSADATMSPARRVNSAEVLGLAEDYLGEVARAVAMVAR